MSARSFIFCVLIAAAITILPEISHAQRGRLTVNQAFRCLGGGVSAGYHWRTPGPNADYYNPYSDHNSMLVTGAVPQGASCYMSRMRQHTSVITSCGDSNSCIDTSGYPEVISETAPMMLIPDAAEKLQPAIEVPVPDANQFTPDSSPPSSVIDDSDTTQDSDVIHDSDTTQLTPANENSFYPAVSDSSVGNSASKRASLWPGLYESKSLKVHSIPYPIQNRNGSR